MTCSKEENPDDPVTELLCEARRQTIEEKISGIKKAIYVAFLVNALWMTALELILRYGVK